MLLISEDYYKNVLIHNFNRASNTLKKKIAIDKPLEEKDYKDVSSSIKEIINYALLDTINYPESIPYTDIMNDLSFLNFLSEYHEKDKLRNFLTNYFEGKNINE